MTGLTFRQHELLTFIDSYQITRDGVSPSYDEMCEAVGLKSKSGIHRIIVELENRGYIRRIPAHARAVEILKRPDVSYADLKRTWLAASASERRRVLYECGIV